MELTKLQIKPLSGLSDWPVWKRRIRDFLDYHDGALSVIDGTLVRPAVLAVDATEGQRKQFKEQSDRYRKANNYVKSMITSALTEETYQKVTDKDSARDVWEELKRNFEASSKDQLFRICADFFSFSWTASDDVSTHVAKLKTLWNELNVGLLAKGETRLPEMMLICKILHILPIEYQSFKSSWMLLSDEKQTVDELTMQLCSFGRDTKCGAVSKTTTEALVVKSANPHIQKQQGKKKFVKGNCNYCSQPGHWIKSCSKWIADGRPKRGQVPAAAATSISARNSSSTNVVLTVYADILSAETVSGEWYVDDGATRHVTNQHDIFVNFEQFKVPHTVTAAGGQLLPAFGKGTVEVLSTVGDNVQKFMLADVWYVPNIGVNLFSVLAAEDRNPHKSCFFSSCTECWLEVDDRVVLHGTRKPGGTLYRAHIRAVSCDINIVASVATDDSSVVQLYHERFGHQNRRHVQAVIKRELNIDTRVDKDMFCEDCVYGKSHRLPFGSRCSADKPGEIKSADVCGPFDESFRKYRYFVVFKDHYSKMRFIAFLQKKSGVVDALKDLLASVKTQGHIVKELISDNGGEFDNNEVRSVLRSHGIVQRLSAPYTPEQAGAAERENRTIVETARTLKYSNPEVEYPAGIWAELCQTAVYILNRTGKSSEEDKTPWEVWTGKKPRIKHLRVIGSVCYSHIPASIRRKMDKKAVRGYLIGYDGDERYRIYIKEQHKVILCSDVVFQEKLQDCKEHVELPMSDVKPSDQNIQSETEPETDDKSKDSVVGDNEQGELNQRHLRDRSLLAKPKKFGDFVLSAHSTETHLTVMNEPESYSEAVSSTDRRQWIKAMDSELESLAKNHTWDLTGLPPNAKGIPSK
jgi:transposase InsO family protein